MRITASVQINFHKRLRTEEAQFTVSKVQNIYKYNNIFINFQFEVGAPIYKWCRFKVGADGGSCSNFKSYYYLYPILNQFTFKYIYILYVFVGLKDGAQHIYLFFLSESHHSK